MSNDDLLVEDVDEDAWHRLTAEARTGGPAFEDCQGGGGIGGVDPHPGFTAGGS